MHFADHFSAQAATYASHRPSYPPALFDWLASLVPRHAVAWDCATGNGQAAVMLAERVARVVATDASAAQIAHATPHPRVSYAVAPAEASGLGDASVDLVTVAQALHWLDLGAFWREVRRVARPGGTVVVWSYADATLETPELDAAFRRHTHEVMGPYWPAERMIVGPAYLDLPFPFEEIVAPPLVMEARWTLDELVGYARSWSASQRFIAERGEDPSPLLVAALAPHWGAAERRLVRWPLTVRAGRTAA